MTYDLVCERRAPDLKVTGPQDLIPSLLRFAKKRQEHFLVITLDGAASVIRVHIVSIGLLNRTLIHPREVFIRAIKDCAANVILAHNHPSGKTDPSREDKEATQRLVQAGLLLGIPVLDHLIVAGNRYLSFQETGLMPASNPY